jgi:hypothetical protein
MGAVTLSVSLLGPASCRAKPAFLTRDLNVALLHLIALPHRADVADGVRFAGF